MQWRTIDGVTLDPLGEFNELETLMRGVLAPPMLLDYLRFFVLFETMAAGQEDRRLPPVPRGARGDPAGGGGVAPRKRHKGGVVWHTQGSGKSITMTCFAARVMQEAAMENPTIVVITDRNDLDGQLFGVFSLAQDLLREQPVQANTRQDLRAKLATARRAALFSPPSRNSCRARTRTRFPVLSERHNIVVIADEAHRTQYGFEASSKSAGISPGNRSKWATSRQR
jgi:type I restriction enzyme R subunit